MLKKSILFQSFPERSRKHSGVPVHKLGLPLHRRTKLGGSFLVLPLPRSEDATLHRVRGVRDPAAGEGHQLPRRIRHHRLHERSRFDTRILHGIFRKVAKNY